MADIEILDATEHLGFAKDSPKVELESVKGERGRERVKQKVGGGKSTMAQSFRVGQILRISPTAASLYPGLLGRHLQIVAPPDADHPDEYEILVVGGLGLPRDEEQLYWVKGFALMALPE
jgi:hypothetical protein